jgi:hypothetical protein
VRLSFAVALLVAAIAFQAAPLRASEQAIQQLAPPEEQRIEVISAGDGTGQRVEVISHGTDQTVGEHVPPTPSEKAASRVGKFMLGVASAGVALGVMAASFLLF